MEKVFLSLAIPLGGLLILGLLGTTANLSEDPLPDRGQNPTEKQTNSATDPIKYLMYGLRTGQSTNGLAFDNNTLGETYEGGGSQPVYPIFNT